MKVDSSNLQLNAYKAIALPLSYASILVIAWRFELQLQA